MNDRELSRASTAAFDDAASFFGAGGGTSDGGSVSGGRFFRDDDGGGDDGFSGDDDIDDGSSLLYSRSLSVSSASRGGRSDITDPLDDFLKRYTINIMPEETVAKLKKRAGPLVFGVNYCPQWDARVTYTAKPTPGAGSPFWWLHKLSYSPGSGAGGRRRRRRRGGVSSFDIGDDGDDDDDLFVEPLEAAAAAAGSDAASASSSSLNGGGGGFGGVAPSAASSYRSSLRALKSRLPPLTGIATLTSPKILLFSWLRLQFVADADLATGGFGVRWRVSTKWSASPGRIGRKERWPVFDGAELKPRWSVDLYTPELTGAIGAPQRQFRGGGGARRRRGRGAATSNAAAGGGGGSANGGGGSVEDETTGGGALAGTSAAAGSGTDDDDDDRGGDDDDTSSLLSSLRSSATSFRGRRRGARGRGRAALDLGHCHLLVPRLDAVVDADAAAVSLIKAAKFVAVTPLRVLAGIPLAAARKTAGRVRKRALPPPVDVTAAAPAAGAPFVAPGGLAFPPLPSFLSRPAATARFSTENKNLAPSPPQFAVRGWPWSLGLADGLESAAAWLRKATEEARSKSNPAKAASG